MNELAREIAEFIKDNNEYFANSDDIAVFYNPFDAKWIAQIAQSGRCVELPNGFAEGSFSTTAEGALSSLYNILCVKAVEWADE